MSVLAEMIQNIIAENARIAQDQEEYQKRYDSMVKRYDTAKAHENPTIGILLCNEKSDRMVELTLPEDSNIYAPKYELYLPDKKLLQKKLIEWLEEEGSSE